MNRVVLVLLILVPAAAVAAIFAFLPYPPEIVHNVVYLLVSGFWAGFALAALTPWLLRRSGLWRLALLVWVGGSLAAMTVSLFSGMDLGGMHWVALTAGALGLGAGGTWSVTASSPRPQRDGGTGAGRR